MLPNAYDIATLYQQATGCPLLPLDEDLPADTVDKWRYDLSKTLTQPDTLLSFFQTDQQQ